MTTARDLMSTNPITIGIDASLREAARLLYTLDFRHLPVIDERGKLVGMLSDRDLHEFSVPYSTTSEYLGSDPGALDVHVGDRMSGGVLAVKPDDEAADVVDLMLVNKIGAVPVVGDGGKIVGIVSYVDVLRALPLAPRAEA
jgi:acetoin utilization protein AcuB